MATDWHRRSDSELLKAVPANADAFKELYVRHEAVVVAFLQRRTSDAELTADLTAETFAAAYLGAHRFRDDGGAPAVAWLLGIARHRLLRALEKGRAEQRACARLGFERAPLDDASIERIHDVLDVEDAGNPLRAALAALPVTQREAVRAHVLGERSYDDVARELGVAPATVRQRVSRGLARMRTTLEGQP